MLANGSPLDWILVVHLPVRYSCLGISVKSKNVFEIVSNKIG